MVAPKLRFKEFDGDWDLKNLGDCFSLFSGYAFPSSASVDNGTKWLKIADVGIQEMTPNNLSFLPNNFTTKFPQFIVSKNDYVIALTRPILNKKLKIAKVGEFYDGALLNQRVAKIVSENNNLDFIYSLLQKSKTVEELENSIAGTDPPNLSLNEVKGIVLGIPKVEEQTKIASFLSAVDEKISQLTRKHELLSQYKQGMMQKLFSQQLRFKADDGSAFGEWEEILVQYLVDKGILEKPMDGNHGEIHPTSKDYVEEGIPFVMATDIFNGKLHLEQTKKLTKQQADSLKKGFSREGDVLLTHKANIGNVAIVPQLDVEYLMLTPQVTYYRVINFSRLNNNFLKVYFESPQFQKNLLDLCTGATRLYIGISEQRKLPISLPCLEEQTKIANLLSAIDQKIEVVAQQIEQAKTWKKGLLQQMFV